MSALLLEYECRVPVDGYEVITVEAATDDGPQKKRMLQPRSLQTRNFDLFEFNSSAFLEFAQTAATEDGIKDFADRYGPLYPDGPDDLLDIAGRTPPAFEQFPGRCIDAWPGRIKGMLSIIELWNMSRKTGDFSRVIRRIQRRFSADWEPRIKLLGLKLGLGLLEKRSGANTELLLKQEPSGSPRICIRPHDLKDALYTQLLLMIAGNVNLRACVQCRKWFTLQAGQGRSDKEYCSDACRMRAYRKRKGAG
jgi:hypothetical protein